MGTMFQPVPVMCWKGTREHTVVDPDVLLEKTDGAKEYLSLPKRELVD